MIAYAHLRWFQHVQSSMFELGLSYSKERFAQGFHPRTKFVVGIEQLKGTLKVSHLLHAQLLPLNQSSL